MAIQDVISWQQKIPYYLRYTCENCGCRTPWITGEIVVAEHAKFRGTYNRTQADLDAAKALEADKAAVIERLKRELSDCCAGRRMLPEEISELTGGVINYFGNVSCPKCKHVPSWAPRLAPGFTKKKKQKNADAFNATPVLSTPEVVFGGDLPAPAPPDFKEPCRLEIHGSSFGVPHASPVWLNGVKIGETQQSSVDVSVDTYYKDNLITIDQPLWTSYVEGEEGKTLNLEYKNFMVHRK